MVSWCTSILLGVASLLVASFACAGADSKPGALTPVALEQVIPTASKADVTVSPTAPAAESVSTPGPASATNYGMPTSVADPLQPADGVAVAGKDLTDAQQKDMDAQIAELRKSPDVLAECARETGDRVPAPGSAGEIEWHAAAAIKYAACASSKTTGVDLRGK